HGELQHERREPDARRVRGEVGNQHERLDDRLVLEEGAIAVGGVRGPRVRACGKDQTVRHDERVLSGVFGRNRQRREKAWIAERFGITEPHSSILTAASGYIRVMAFRRTYTDDPGYRSGPVDTTDPAADGDYGEPAVVEREGGATFRP